MSESNDRAALRAMLRNHDTLTYIEGGTGDASDRWPEAAAKARAALAQPDPAEQLAAALRWAESMILQHCTNEDSQTPDIEPIRAALAAYEAAR